MTPFAHQLILWAARAGIVGVVVSSAGLLAQVATIMLGHEESPALTAAFGTLGGSSLVALTTLAVAVWSREGKGEK